MSRSAGSFVRKFAGPILVFCAALASAPFIAEILDIDFNKAYYPTGRSVLTRGTFHYTHEGFKNLPIVAYLLVPFAKFDRTTAADLFLASELVVFLASFISCLWFFVTNRRDGWVLLVLFVLCRHSYTCLRFGQLTPLCFLLLILMVAAYERRKNCVAGTLLALGFVLKIPAGVFFFYALYRKRVGVVAASVVTYIGVLVASILCFGLDLHADYVRSFVFENMGTTVTGHNNPSIAAAMMRFLRPDELFSWKTVALPPLVETVSAAALVVMLVGFWKSTSRRPPGGVIGTRIELSMVTCIALMAFSILWDHYYLFLILPFYFSMQAIEGLEKRGLAGVVWLVAFALTNFPVLHVLREHGDLLAHPALRNAIPAVPLVGCLTLLVLLMGLCLRLPLGDAESSGEASAI